MMRQPYWRSCAVASASLELHSTMSCAPRACSWAMTDCILPNMESQVATTRIGMRSSTSASGPCFISPARMPSLHAATR